MCLMQLVNKLKGKIMAKPTDFLLNTDYQLDKIILFKEGQFTTQATVPHNLGYKPLTFGVWSTDPDFSETYPITGRDSAPEPFYEPMLSISCDALENSLELNSVGNTNNDPIYYRIYGFEPANVNKNAPKTSDKTRQFILNTDYNYRKLLAAGEFTHGGEEFTHNLGYIPQVMAWIEYKLPPYYTSQLNSASLFTKMYMTVTDTKITFNADPDTFAGLVDKIHWRVYYDKA